MSLRTRLLKPRNWLLAILAGSLAACATPVLPEYTVSRDSLFYLQQLPANQVSVGVITGEDRALARETSDPLLACANSWGDGAHSSANGADYIRNALIQELTAAGRYSQEEDAPRIEGSVERISLNRAIPFGGKWHLALRLTSSTGAELRVEKQFPFDVGSLAGPTVCSRALEHFEPAVRSLLEEAIRSPDFASLVAPA